MRNVFTEDATPHPDGAYYVFELIWRGGVYGTVDALLLTVLPCLIVYRSLGGRLTTWRRRLAYFGVSLALVWTITAVYHLGYTQYREDGIGAPETGNTIISMPMLLTNEPHRLDRRPCRDAHLRGDPRVRDAGAPASAEPGGLSRGLGSPRPPRSFRGCQ